MTFEAKRAEALAILAKTGIWRSNYAPPVIGLLWRLGVKVPPPHFAPFWLTAVTFGAGFAVAWGMLMWFTFWSPRGAPLVFGIIGAVVAGAFFGLWMAAYYAYGRRKYGLPSWRSLGGRGQRT